MPRSTSPEPRLGRLEDCTSIGDRWHGLTSILQAAEVGASLSSPRLLGSRAEVGEDGPEPPSESLEVRSQQTNVSY